MRDTPTTRSGWAIHSPWQGVMWDIFRTTRSEAIAEFCRIVDADCYDEAVAKAKEGRVWPKKGALSPAQSKAWREWRNKGFMAVHAYVQICDRRVR